MKIIPQNKKILIKPLPAPEKVTESGIILADDSKVEELFRGEVLHAGESGFSVGNVVSYSRYGVDKISVDAVEFHIIHVTSVAALIET